MFEALWQFINQNSAGLSVIINCALCIIWLVYLHLLLKSYRRQRCPKIIISRVHLGEKKTHCLISNLSAETVHIHSFIIGLTLDNGDTIEAGITDPEAFDESKNTNIKDLTVQGPLKPGEYIDAGSFKNFIDRCLREHGKEKQDQSVRHSNISKVRITVLASFSTDILSIAAKREFSLYDNFIEPESVETTQIRSRRERKKLTKYLEKFL